MTVFHPRRALARRTAMIEAGAALVLAIGGAAIDPVIWIFAVALGIGAAVMWKKSIGNEPLLEISSSGITAPAGAARWQEITGYGLARFGSSRRGKDCFWVETAPGGPEFKSLHGDQILAAKNQLRIPFADFDPADPDPLEIARAIRPDLEVRL